MIKLYDYELSGSCYKVRLLLNILAVPFEKVPVDFVNKEHTSDRYLALNPLGELPILEDGLLRLRDAQAILVYLALKYDANSYWYPDDAATRGQISQWLATAGGELMSVSAARLVKALNYPLDLDQLHASAHRVLAIINDHLANREFLVLDHPTIADIACFPYSALANEAGIDISPYPHLVSWIVRMRGIAGFVSMPGVWPA
jgi:glutathione S-transferase